MGTINEYIHRTKVYEDEIAERNVPMVMDRIFYRCGWDFLKKKWGLASNHEARRIVATTFLDMKICYLNKRRKK